MLKIKTIEYDTAAIAQVIERFSMIFMATAALTGIVELPNYINNHLTTLKPQVAYVNQTANLNSSLLREKEESGPHYITYGINRTVTRSGRR